MSPIDIEDILERAKNSSQVGDHEEAERLLKNYIAKVPASRDARLLLGTTFAREGKLAEAADEFVNLLARDPQDMEALNNAAVICRRQGKYQDALGYLMEAIDIDPTRAEFHYNIGNIHKQLGNSKAAAMAYAKVIELDPGYVSAYNNLGTIYERTKEYDKAYNIFRKGLALDNNNPTLHFNYGIALEANGRLDDAAGEYRAAARSKPGWLDPMNNLGIILFKQGQHDKAIAAFNRILHTDPFNAEARNNMGVVQADQGKTREAVKNYRRAIEADPTYTKAVVNLERTLEASGDFSDAVIELEKLIKLSPASAEIRNRLAGLYLKMERYPEALEQAESALEWEPESIQALRTKGAVQRIMGNDAEAQGCFEKILSLDPGNYTFLLDLADIHFRRKEYNEAEERIQSYLIRRPNDRNAKLLLGKLYAEMGNRTHAIQVFEELSKADPNDTEALAAAAELHKKAGFLEKAVRTADKLVNVQGKRATANDLSELNKSLEFYENAVNAYSSSVREMWSRNIKLMGGGEEEETPEDDISRLMGAAGTSPDIDEETEALFTEGMEFFSEEAEDEGELILDDEGYGDIPEEAEQPRYKDPLDALAEASPGGHDPFASGRPSSYSPEAGAAEQEPPDSPPGESRPPSAESPAETQGSEVSAPKAPELPGYPSYPQYPPYGQTPPAPEPAPAGDLNPQPPEETSGGEEETLLGEELPGEETELSPETEFPGETPDEEAGLEPELSSEEFPGEEAELSPETEFPGETPDEEAGLEPELSSEEFPGGEDEMLLGEEFPAGEEDAIDLSVDEEIPEDAPPPGEDMLLPETMELLPGGDEVPLMGEEIPEELFSEDADPFADTAGETEAGAGLPGEDSGFGPEFPETESPFQEAALQEAGQELSPPETDSSGETPGEAKIIPQDTAAFAPETGGGASPEKDKNIAAVIGLLNCLKEMTGELPETEKGFYLKGKFPKALESVIDSLRNLAIIKD